VRRGGEGDKGAGVEMGEKGREIETGERAGDR
jgi:hypothetical protein